ncbi:MAG: PAS domain S-box protein [Dehalococcoidales bacterium]|nr:PAS domain S-box protein [Dehalococcoidales bacterium]
MTISRKVIITTLCIVAVAFLATYFLCKFTLTTSFQKIEQQTMERNINRVNNVLAGMLNNLEIITTDWANWYGTYQFAVDRNTDYIQRDLTDENFEFTELNFIAVVDLNHNVIFQKAYDLDKHTEIPVPQEFESYLTSNTLISYTDTSPGTTGILLTADTAFLISAEPILTSYMKGPVAGTLVFGRIINPAMIDELSNVVQRSVTLWQLNNSQIPGDVSNALDSITQPGDIFIEPLDDNNIAGYSMTDDIFGNPALIMKVTALRDIYQQGQRTILFFILILAIICIVFSLIYFYVLKRTFLSRLSTVSRSVGEIGITGDISKNIPVNGNDELAHLSSSINNMLGKLRQTTNELCSQKNLTDRILHFSPNIVFVVDSQKNIKMANKAFCDLFGITEADAIGQPLNKFVPPENITELDTQFVASGSTKLDSALRYPIHGVERTFDISIIFMNENEYLLIGKDITEENALRERFYLNDRLASIGEMAAGIAHELNNPLTGIIMLSQTIMQDDIPEELKQDMNDINNEACRASEVVKHLLAFARKQAPSKCLTQINKTIQDVLKLREYEQAVNNIEVTTILDPNLPEIMVDNIQIQQVFLNLILNAEYSMIHSHNGGKFHIESYVFAEKIIISLTDNGSGIKDENMKKLFQPFFTTKEVGVGTGLGLSLCYGIITRHGGAIYAKSKWGHGATFTVELPIITTDTNGNGNGNNGY